MHTIQVTPDLVIEVWFDADGDESPMLKLRSLAQEQDKDPTPGVVVIRSAEIRLLVAALVETAGVLAEHVVKNAQRPSV